MEGLRITEPTELYNLINRRGKYPNISDSNYLLILDARPKDEYSESHIFLAKRAPKNEKDEFQVPYDAELECKENIVVYDGKTQSKRDNSPAIKCGTLMWQRGSRNPVKILRGGYELFSAIYPFLRTQEMIYMPRELDIHQTYPLEIVPGSLYLGDWSHGNTAYIQKDLKIQGHINCSVEQETFFKDPDYVLHIPVEDQRDVDLFSKFQQAVQFIDERNQDGFAVLVFSEFGISRGATIALAYIMYRKGWRLKEAYRYIRECNPLIQPNRGFIEQLVKWEMEIVGGEEDLLTDISDPNY